VLAREVGELLSVRPGDSVIDCTFGAGGHSRLLAAALEGRGHYVAIDRDPDVRPYLDAFARDLGPGIDLRVHQGPFALVLRNLAATGEECDAVLMDLGISSMHVDRPQRGFSYAHDGPLDMRMDPRGGESAADAVNGWDEADLASVFQRFGEERHARRIARAIVRERERTPFTRTMQLADVVKRAIPTPSRFGQGHPAKRVFQALRIAVNGELDELREGLVHAMELVRPGGRLAVISFHSLEDRMVKHAFRDAARGCICPPDLPICGCGRSPEFRVVNARAVTPSAAELARNPRASSGRLRVVQREVRA